MTFWQILLIASAIPIFIFACTYSASKGHFLARREYIKGLTKEMMLAQTLKDRSS